MSRRKIPNQLIVQVLTEAGYRCAVPTCRTILAIDIHHMVEVSEGGGNEMSNLLPLCPTCHALYHRGEIKHESIYTWKSMLVALSQAFDTSTIDDLLFLGLPETSALRLSSDGVLNFSRLIAAGLATFKQVDAYWSKPFFQVNLTEKGQQLISAWKSGDRKATANVLIDA